MKNKFTIAIPTFNGEAYIKPTLKSIFNQSFTDFQIVVSDDCSTDKTIKIIKSFKDKRIKVYKNKKNLGYGKNLQVLNQKINTDILFLMGQDDILLKDALKKTFLPFLEDKSLGVITRPFYWFDKDILKPVRAISPYSWSQDKTTNILDNKKVIKKFFESTAQLSGIAFRNNLTQVDFHPDIFTAHIYPLANISKKYKILFLKDYTVAVRISSSQTRRVSSIYNKSPLQSWVEMINKIYPEKKYDLVRKTRLKQIATHFLGLVQIKNFGQFSQLLREIYYHLKYWPKNIFNPAFWFFSLGTILLPKKILLVLTDNFKRQLLFRKYKNIKLKQT